MKGINIKKASQSERFCDMFNKSIGLVVKHYELNLWDGGVIIQNY